MKIFKFKKLLTFFGLFTLTIISFSLITSTSIQNSSSNLKQQNQTKNIVQTDISSILKNNYQPIQSSINLDWSNGHIDKCNFSFTNNYLSNIDLASQIDKSIKLQIATRFPDFNKLPDITIDNNSNLKVGFVVNDQTNSLNWKNSNNYSNYQIYSNDYGNEIGVFYNTQINNQKIKLKSIINASNYHSEKWIWEDDRLIPNLRQLLITNAHNLNFNQPIYLWFNQTGTYYKKVICNYTGVYNHNSQEFHAQDANVQFLSVSNNPQAFINNLQVKKSQIKNNHLTGSYPTMDNDQVETYIADGGLKFFVELDPQLLLIAQKGTTSGSISVADFIRNAQQNDPEYNGAIKNSYKQTTDTQQSLSFFNNQLPNVTLHNITTQVSNQSFKYENQIYQLKPASFTIPTFYNFDIHNVLTLTTNQNSSQMHNGVLVNQTPTLTFAFNPIFANLLINLHNLINQHATLTEILNQSSNVVDQASIKNVLTQIENKFVDYQAVQTYIDGITSSGVNLTLQPQNTTIAPWYQQAIETYNLNLSNNVTTWPYFLKLVSQYFSQDIYCDLNLGDAQTQSQFKIWDPNTFSFIPITNNANQSELLQSQNLSQITISNLGFSSNSNRPTNIINQIDLNTINNQLVPNSSIKLLNNQITYTYPYRIDYLPTAFGNNQTITHKTRAIIYRDPDPQFATYYSKDIDINIVRDSLNTYLASIGITNKMKLNGLNTIEVITNPGSPLYSEQITTAINALKTKYNLNLIPNSTNGQFWAIVNISNANDLGDKRRLENPFPYVYYLNGCDFGSASAYLLQFESPIKSYSINDLKFDTQGIYVNNVSQDAINQYGQQPKLYFDNSDWTDILKPNLNNQTLTLTAINDKNVGFGYYATNEYYEDFLHDKLNNYNNRKGTLPPDITSAFLNYLTSISNKTFFLNSPITFDGSKTTLTFNLDIAFTLQNGSITTDPTEFASLKQSASQYEVSINSLTLKTTDSNVSGELILTLNRDPKNSTKTSVVNLPYTITTTKAPDVNGYLAETKTLQFDFSKLNSWDYQWVVSTFFMDSSPIDNAYASVQTKFANAMLEFLIKEFNSYQQINYQIPYTNILKSSQELFTKNANIYSPNLTFTCVSNQLAPIIQPSPPSSSTTNPKNQSTTTPLIIGLSISIPILVIIISTIIAIRFHHHRRIKKIKGS